MKPKLVPERNAISTSLLRGACAAACIAAIAAPRAAEAQVCPPATINYTEGFTNDSMQDPESTVQGWGGAPPVIKLPFQTALIGGGAGDLGRRVIAAAAGNFDRDADDLEDLIGLVYEINPPKIGDIDPGPTCRFELFVNLGMDGASPPGHLGFAPGVPILDKDGNDLVPPSCTEPGAVLRAGDIDGDGTEDLLYTALEDMDGDGRPLTWTDTYSHFYVWRNCPHSAADSPGVINGNCPAMSFSPGDMPIFTPMQKTMSGTSPGTRPDTISWHWAGDSIQLVDWNLDTPDPPNIYDRKDLLVAKSRGGENEVFLYYACDRINSATCASSDDFSDKYGFGWSWSASGGGGVPTRLELIGDTGFAANFATTGNESPLPTVCDAAPSRGITVTLVTDVDLDGDQDIILGSMSHKNLRLFVNTGSNAAPVFDNANVQEILFDEGGPTYGVVLDHNQDTFPDLVIATDKYSCGGSGGEVWLLENNGRGGFSSAPTGLVDVGTDVDWLLTLDANGDGFDDLMVGRRTWKTPYYLALADESSIYQTKGVAISKIRPDGLDPDNDTIVNVTVKIKARKGGSPQGDETLYVSNNGGDTWELITDNELPPTSDVHYFTSYGYEFRWKLEMEYEEVLGGADLRFAPGAKESPAINQLKFIYEVARGEVRFTRSGIAYGILKDSGNKEIIYSASSIYPGFAAALRAYDITDCNPVPAGNLEDAACVDDLWETANADPSRPAYTAYAAGGTGPVNDRLTITTPLSATVQAVLATTDDADWDFVKKGLESLSMMHDIGHSTPVFVGAPLKATDELQSNKYINEVFYDPNGTLGYRAFVDTNQSRRSAVYIGANDGMLHALDAVTGLERWVFVPHNLAPKLKTQRRPADEYKHGYFVDGPVVVRDVYDANAGIWRTILIGGQARGKGFNPETGAFDQNNFFALDVTDPLDPKPLWEFNDPWVGFGGWCDGDPFEWVASGDCSSASTCDPTPCAMTYSTLQANTPVGRDQIRIDATGWLDFPATGVVEIERNDPLKTEIFRYSKSGGNRLDLQDATGAVAITTLVHSNGAQVNLWPEHVFQETTDNEIVIETEAYQQHRRVKPTDRWTIAKSEPGYSGDGYTIVPNAGSTGNCNDNITTCGAEMRYTMHFDTTGSWDVYARVYYAGTGDRRFHWGLDGNRVQRNRDQSGYNAWRWVDSLSGTGTSPRPARVSITEPGLHTFHIWQIQDGAILDQIVLVPQGDSGPSNAEPMTCEEKCPPVGCETVYTYTKKSVPTNPSTEDWPECGTGKKCCDVPGSPDLHFCQPTADICPATVADMETVLGETWSPPAVGKFRVDNMERWLVIFASGYNSDQLPNAGRSIYAVDIFDGSMVGRWDLDDLVEDGSNPVPIRNSVPGGVTLIDLDDCYAAPVPAGCGFVDRIYVGDLEGRLWKIDTQENAGLGGYGLVSEASWPKCVVFDAGDADHNGTRAWAPIITKPAVAILSAGTANIYFGTGGDDRADNSILYRFYSVRDEDISGTNACQGPPKYDNDLYSEKGEWIIGDGRMNDGDPVTGGTLFDDVDPPHGPPLYPADADDWEGVAGDRYWSDPIIVNGTTVVFVSLYGKIDSIDICAATEGESAAYAYAIRRFSGLDETGTRRTYEPGDRYRYHPNLRKVRQAANVRGIMEGLGYNVYGVTGIARNMAPTTTPVEAFAQETASPGNDTGTANVVRLFSGQVPGYIAPRNNFKILRWREIRL